jgi:hypothetical protein
VRVTGPDRKFQSSVSIMAITDRTELVFSGEYHEMQVSPAGVHSPSRFGGYSLVESIGTAGTYNRISTTSPRSDKAVDQDLSGVIWALQQPTFHLMTSDG